MVTRTKTKSREKLYNMMEGVNNVTGPAGLLASGSIQFANIPVAGETVTIGGYVFEAQAGASEAPGTSAGTAADPHLFQSITSLATAGAELASVILAETATTGAYGYLYPDDSVGVDFTTDTLTLQFWPGTAGNSVTLAGSAGDETIVQPTGGRTPFIYDFGKKCMVLDTTGSTQNLEYYILPDGEYVGQEVLIIVDVLAASDTPTIVGNFVDTTGVQAQFSAAKDFGKWFWNGAGWETVAGADAVYTAAV